jgi:hypothetical protein
MQAYSETCRSAREQCKGSLCNSYKYKKTKFAFKFSAVLVGSGTSMILTLIFPVLTSPYS